MANIQKFDVIVVGYGIAGAAAAIEAADNGARVLVLDRGYGGGASALSGGVVYAGGGTAQQQEAGYSDTPENLYNYLVQEVGDAVDEATLRRFCTESPDMIRWLELQGAEFASSVVPYKTSYPTDDYYLYFSGNEKAHPYNLTSEPAPRGHRAVAKGLGSGKALWNHLRASAEKKGVTFVPIAHVTDLITEDKRVVGVRYRALDQSHPNAPKHAKLTKSSGKLGNWAPDLVAGSVKKIEQLWNEGAVDFEARASAVILSAGGFIYNREMVKEHAPLFEKVKPLGTPGDDGWAIQQGLTAGGTVSHMGNVTAWRFLSPPSAFIEGVAVGMNGKRIANEDLYGATLGDVLMREFGGSGWAVYDADNWRKGLKQIKSQTQIFQKLQVLYLVTVGHKKARTLEALAKKMGVDAEGLRATVDAYNSGLESGTGDPAHKAADVCHPLRKAPYYAFNISVVNAPFFSIPGLTLGGLRVDGQSGEVLHRDGGVIPGLYAAGRSAVGVCSKTYLSGLSLADGIFAGRRAGMHAATVASTVSEAVQG